MAMATKTERGANPLGWDGREWQGAHGRIANSARDCGRRVGETLTAPGGEGRQVSAPSKPTRTCLLSYRVARPRQFLSRLKARSMELRPL